MNEFLWAAGGAAAGGVAAYWLLKFRWVLPLELRAGAREEEAAAARSLLGMLSDHGAVPATVGLLRERLARMLEDAQTVSPGLRLWFFERGAKWELLACAGANPVTESSFPSDATLARFVSEGVPVEVAVASKYETAGDRFFAALEAEGWSHASVFRGEGKGTAAEPGWLLVAAGPKPEPLERARPLLGALARFCSKTAATSRRIWELEGREKDLKDSMARTIQELTSTNIRLAQRSREMRTLFQVASTLTSNPAHPGTSLSALVAIIAKALEADVCAFMLLDEEKNELVTQPGAYGIAGDEISLYRLPLSNEQASSVRVFLSGESFLSTDAQEDPRTVGAYARLWKAHSLIVVPLKIDGRAMGVLRVGSFRKDHFTEDHLRFAGLIAQEAAVIIESAMLYQQVAQTARQLADLNRMKDDFISTVSHELKTPLTSIQGFLSVLLSGDAGDLDAQQKRFIGIAKNAANRLSLLIGDLLDLSRLEGGVEMEFSESNLAEVVRHSIELHAPQAQDAKIDLRATVPDNLPKVWADSKWVLQVVDNLVSNAIKFTPPNGTVAVSLLDKGDMVMATVTDTGVGIPDRHKERIFEKFYRVREDPTFSPPGTGLGLAIAKFVVEKHNGKIWVESEPGQGSRFHFVLPSVTKERPPRAPARAGRASKKRVQEDG